MPVTHIYSKLKGKVEIFFKLLNICENIEFSHRKKKKNSLELILIYFGCLKYPVFFIVKSALNRYLRSPFCKIYVGLKVVTPLLPSSFAFILSNQIAT